MIVEYCTCFVLHFAEDGCMFPRCFSIKDRWKQACRIHDTMFHGRFDVMKSDHNLIHASWKMKAAWAEYSLAISLDYRRRKMQKNQCNKHPKHSKIGWLLKSCWREDLLQSKSASLSQTFGWLSWLEIAIYGSFYTVLENGYKFLRCFWIKGSEHEHLSYCSHFDLIKTRS